MILVAIVLGIAESLLGGWMLMLILGIVHAEVLDAVHPVGFGTSFVLAVLVSIFHTAFSISNKITED